MWYCILLQVLLYISFLYDVFATPPEHAADIPAPYLLVWMDIKISPFCWQTFDGVEAVDEL